MKIEKIKPLIIILIIVILLVYYFYFGVFKCMNNFYLDWIESIVGIGCDL